MKRIQLYLTLLLVGVLVQACQSDISGSDQETALPESTRQIERIVASIREVQDTLTQRGPLSVARGDLNYEVRSMSRKQEPLIIRAESPRRVETYYLQNRQVIHYNELLIPGGNGPLTENEYFYSQDTLLSARTRSAAGQQALQEASFEKLNLNSKAELRSVEVVNTQAISFLYGQ